MLDPGDKCEHGNLLVLNPAVLAAGGFNTTKLFLEVFTSFKRVQVKGQLEGTWKEVIYALQRLPAIFCIRFLFKCVFPNPIQRETLLAGIRDLGKIRSWEEIGSDRR
jgi:hypothetical protein